MWDQVKHPSTTILNRKSKMRTVRRSKWELPNADSAAHWNGVIENIESRITRVRPSLSLFPQLSVRIRPESSARSDGKSESNLSELNNQFDRYICEPVVRVSPPSPFRKESKNLSSPLGVSESVSSIYFQNFSSNNAKVNPTIESERHELAPEINERENSSKNKSDIPTFTKIVRLTKISSYINDFLSNARVNVGPSVIPKNTVRPIQTSSEAPRKAGNYLFIERASSTRSPSENCDEKVDVIQTGNQALELSKKQVGFQEMEEDENQRRLRPRAPSLGVASAVPSFGKILSSLEHSDSLETSSLNESASNTQLSLSGTSKDPPRTPQRQMTPAPIEQKNLLQVPKISSCPRLHRTEQLRSGKSQRWPHKSIVHILRALKLMKRDGKLKDKIKHRDQSASLSFQVPVTSSDSSVDRGLSDLSLEQSVTSSSVSICSYKSVRKRLPDLPSLRHQEKIDSDVETSANDPKVPRVSLLTEIPQISGMYPRKKGDKCLACLHMSVASKDDLRLNQPPEPMSSPSLENSILDELNSILRDEQAPKCISDRGLAINSDLSNDNIVDGSAVPSIGTPEVLIINRTDAGSEPKRDRGADKRGVVSSRSLISTQSLASERSKTISDQDDSDQAIDEALEVEEGVVESRLKFLAPCHAPLNLRPSLEPLRALRNKTARSIQSRMASLEKSTDAGSDGASDDDELAAKTKDDNGQRAISPRPEDESTSKIRDNKHSGDILMFIDDCIVFQQSHQDSTISREIFAKLNKTSRVDYDPSDSFRALSPILSDAEVLEISKTCLGSHGNVVATLSTLANEYVSRLSKKVERTGRVEGIVKRLLMLLVESKRYLHSSPNLELPLKQKLPINSRQLRRVLPVKSYNLIAPLLGIPQWHPKRWSAVRDARRLRSTSANAARDVRPPGNVHFAGERRSSSDLDLAVHPSSQDNFEGARRKKQLSPYAAFLTKPRRKAVIWRPLTERDLEGFDPDATLKKRAANLTDAICSDFCQWLTSLGGVDTSVDVEVLKDMFETDFTADACRTMQVGIKELPMVPTAITDIRHCPEAGELEITRKHLRRDAKAEKMPTKLRAFGSALPRHLRFLPPSNQVEAKWLDCENVPGDLESMETVWKDIAHLDSVRGFIQWLEARKVQLPRCLRNAGGRSKKSQRD